VLHVAVDAEGGRCVGVLGWELLSCGASPRQLAGATLPSHLTIAESGIAALNALHTPI